jgi:hypothetical protein
MINRHEVTRLEANSILSIISSFFIFIVTRSDIRTGDIRSFESPSPLDEFPGDAEVDATRIEFSLPSRSDLHFPVASHFSLRRFFARSAHIEDEFSGRQGNRIAIGRVLAARHELARCKESRLALSSGDGPPKSVAYCIRGHFLGPNSAK